MLILNGKVSGQNLYFFKLVVIFVLFVLIFVCLPGKREGLDEMSRVARSLVDNQQRCPTVRKEGYLGC